MRPIATNINYRTVGRGMTQIGRVVLKSSRTENLKPEDGIILGRALAMDHKKVLVGRDSSSSSAMMANSVISGLLFQGADVIDAGIVSAPAAAMSSVKGDCTVYVAGRRDMVSGYYLLNPDGSMFRDDQIRHLDLFFQNPPARPTHDRLGRYTLRDGITEEFNRKIVSLFEGDTKCTVFLDCRCGTTSDSIPQILNKLGADIVTIDAQRDMDYVGSSEGCDHIMDIVAKSPGCIGIRMNRTGTAIEVIDETGRLLPMETVFALLALYLRPSSIAIPVNSSSLMEDVFENGIQSEIDTPFPEPADRKTVLTRDNASAVCEAMIAGSELGYYHGSILFGGEAAIGNGIRAAAVIAQMAGSNSLHRLADLMPEYLREEKSVDCGFKAEMFRHLFEENAKDLTGKWTQYGDSYRVVMDSGWFMLSHVNRAEGDTQIVITAESKDRAYLAGLMEIADGLTAEIVREGRLNAI